APWLAVPASAREIAERKVEVTIVWTKHARRWRNAIASRGNDVALLARRTATRLAVLAPRTLAWVPNWPRLQITALPPSPCCRAAPWPAVATTSSAAQRRRRRRSRPARPRPRDTAA